MSINRVNISGNLTRDPEFRSTAGGTNILSFGVAVNDSRKNPQTGKWQDVPNFVDCIVFGQRAEALSRFISKGAKVSIDGKLRYSVWENKEGQRRSKLEVVVDEIDFMSRASGQQVTSPAAEAAKVADMPVYGAPRAPEPEFYDADIPF